MRAIETLDQKQHFMSKIQVVDNHWMWAAGLNRANGYGILYVGSKKYVLAHRRSYELFIGPIPEGEWVLHTNKCNIRQCVNPQHLKLGNPKQNSLDCFNFGGRGRSNLTDADIFAIRSSDRPRKELAIQYGLSYHSIMRIQNGRTWKDV